MALRPWRRRGCAVWLIAGFSMLGAGAALARAPAVSPEQGNRVEVAQTDPQAAAGFYYADGADSPTVASGDAETRIKSRDGSRVLLSPLGKSYWVGYFSDFGRLVTAPSRFDTQDWLITGGVLAGFGTLFALDNPIRRFVQNHRSSTTNSISDAVQPFGSVYVVEPALVGGYLVGRITDSPRLQQATLVSIESSLLSGAIVQIGKYAFHRHRPSQSSSAYKFGGPSFQSDGHLSLPSGDAALAWSVASAMSHEYPDKVWLPPVAYGLATLVALERMNVNAHFASDVFLGAAIGYFTGAFLAHLHPTPDRGFSVQAMAVTDGAGVEGVFRF